MGAVLSTLWAYVPTAKLAAAFKFLRDAVVRQFRNDFLAGGLVMAVAGILSNGCWRLLWALREAIHSRLFTTVEVPASSASYPPLLRWLQSQPGAWDSSKLYVQRTRAAAASLAPHADTTDGDDENASFVDRFSFVPAENTSVRLWYRGRLLWITGAKADSSDSGAKSGFMRMPGPRGQSRRVRRGNASSIGFASSYHITIFGRDKSVITHLLREGQRLRKAEANLMTEVHAVSSSLPFKGGTKVGWYKVGARPCRSIDSVILEGDRAKDILADCREFMSSEKWFAERGIPYRRGYLLEGKPGTGKTSLITALAGDLRLPVYMLSLSSPGMTDDTLLSLFHASDPSSLLLLEDIDAAFAGPAGAGQRTMAHAGGGRRRQRRTPPGDDDDDDDDDIDVEPGPPTLTFAGLLNAIDGVVAQQGRLLFMTTNHMERLDPALIRSGRVDYIMNFDLATQDQARRLFTRFFESERSTDLHDPVPDVSNDDDDATAAGPEFDRDSDPRRQQYLQRLARLAEEFGRAVPARKKSMADLQGFLMRYRKRPREALAHAHELHSDRRVGAASPAPAVGGTAALIRGAPPPPGLGRSASAPSARVSERGYGIVGPAVDASDTPHIGAAAAAFRQAAPSTTTGRDQRGGAGAGARAGGNGSGASGRGRRGAAGGRGGRGAHHHGAAKRKGNRGGAETDGGARARGKAAPARQPSPEDEMEAIWSSLAPAPAGQSAAGASGKGAGASAGVSTTGAPSKPSGAMSSSSGSAKTVGASPARSLGGWVAVPEGSPASRASAASSVPANSPPRVVDAAPAPALATHPSPTTQGAGAPAPAAEARSSARRSKRK